MRIAGSVLFLASISALSGCSSELEGAAAFDGLEIEKQAIFHGSPPSLPEHDATVSLHTDYGWLGWGGAFCSGTLIFDDWVLTAAHCLQGVSAGSLGINFGDNSNHTGDIYDVDQVIQHHSYNSWTLANDIGLVQLKSSAAGEADPVMPLPDSLALTNSDEGDDLDVAGFGEQESGGGSYGQLEHVLVEITDVNSKDVEYDQGNGGSGTGGPCQGDSGGPAFITRSGNAYVAGVTSSGDANCTRYGTSTSVDAFESWIESNTGETVKEVSGGGSSSGGTTTDTYTGHINSGEKLPFSFTMASSGIIELTLSGDAGTDFDLYLAEPAGGGFDILDSSTAWFTSTEDISYSAGAGDYFAGVVAYSGSGDYTLTITYED